MRDNAFLGLNGQSEHGLKVSLGERSVRLGIVKGTVSSSGNLEKPVPAQQSFGTSVV